MGEIQETSLEMNRKNSILLHPSTQSLEMSSERDKKGC